MNDIVTVVGSINLDRTIVVERFPSPGETLLGSELRNSFGGKGANQAVAAALSGGHVCMLGAVGDEPEGELAVANLARRGVDVGRIARIAGQPTGTAWITVAAGDNTILVVPGANGSVTCNVMPPRTRVVLCQLEIPLPVVMAASRSGADFFALNASPSRVLPDELLARCDAVIVNEHELAELTDTTLSEVSCDAELAHAAGNLLERGAKAVVTTLGARGAQLCTADGMASVASPAIDKVVDTTGAGDAFCGAFVARVARGSSLAEALRWGVAAGSLAVRKPNAQASYPDFAELEAFLPSVPPVKQGHQA